ncbi:MAG: TIGR03545 family protein [Candidatus Margulisbacteria bacterium]|nr:TIGR03545 family protein [Candidatus Margulisiibacteriota bacterium]
MAKKEKKQKPEKKKRTKIFNSKYLYLLIFSVVFLAVLRLFFLDSLIKLAIVSTGQAIVSAKVDIKKLHFSALQGSLTIENCEIGDKLHPLKNLASFKMAQVRINPGALLSSQVDIENIQLSGLEMGTARKTSAILKKNIPKKPKKKQAPSIIEKTVNQQVSMATSYYSLDAVGKRLQIDKIVNLSSLQLLTKISETSASLNSWPQKFQQDLASPDISVLVSDLNRRWEALKQNTPTDIRQIPDYLKEINSLKAQIDSAQAGIQQKQNSLDNNLKFFDITVQGLQQQANTDLKTLQNKIKMIENQQGNFLQSLVGDRYTGFFEKGKVYLDMVLKKFKKASPPREPVWYKQWLVKGENIEFPIKEHRPKFLIKNMRIDGLFGVTTKEAFVGEIKEIAFNQNVRGIPTTFYFQNKELNSKHKTRIEGTIDYRDKKQLMEVKFLRAGYALAPAYWDEQQIPLRIVSGDYDIHGNLALDHGNINLGLDVMTEKTEFAKSNSFQESNLIHELLYSTAQQSPAINIHVQYKQNQLTIDTDLDEKLAQSFNKILDEQKTRLLKGLQKEWDAQVGAKVNALTQTYKQQTQAIEKQWQIIQKDWNKSINTLQGDISAKEKELSDYGSKLQKQLQDEQNRQLNELDKKKRAEEDKLKQELEQKKQDEQKKLEQNLKNQIPNIFK